MAWNGTGFTEPLVHSPASRARGYSYRQGLGMMPSAEYVVFHDDFLQDITSNVPTGWDAAIIDVGATITSDTTYGNGVILITSDGVGEGAAIYGPKGIQLTSGKRFFMETRVLFVDATNMPAFQFGLSDLTATTNPEDLWTTTAANVLAFGVLADDTDLELLVDAGNSGSTAEQSTETVSDATWHTLGIGYNGANVTAYLDGQLVITWSQAASTIPTGVALAPFVGALTGAADNAHVDYVRYAVER